MSPIIDKIVPFDINTSREELLLDYNQKIFNIQKYLLTLLLIQWFIFVVVFGFGIYSLAACIAVEEICGIQALLPIIIFFVYYTFGLIVTYKHNRIGLLTFGIVGIVLFLMLCVFVGGIVTAVVQKNSDLGYSNEEFQFLIFIGIVLLVMGLIVMMTLKLAFNLAGLMKTSDYTIM